MKAIALADFGSTFTKVTLVQETSGHLISRAQAPTTASSDVLEGYASALDEARSLAADRLSISRRLHASSAGGGLRMAAVGLVPDLTAAAARQAALNAGARVQLVLAGDLSERDRMELEQAKPEVLLFAGGTDGGQEARVLANAEVIASAAVDFTVIVACNHRIGKTVAAAMRQGGRRVRVVSNVMPIVGRLEIEPARKAIEEEFVTHVIRGKGLSRSREFDRSVAMPTPEAVLLATRTLAQSERSDIGGQTVVVVDVGGATTDVYSHTPHVTSQEQQDAERLLPPPELMRTVQGDLGVRWNAVNVYNADEAWIDASVNCGSDPARILNACNRRAEHPAYLSTTREEISIDRALASSCLTVALRRHCGSLRIRHSGRGAPTRRIDGGPDLREARVVVGSGGVIVYDPNGADTIRAALSRRDERSLAPTAPRVLVDSHYVLPAAGLLSTISDHLALNLLEGALSE